jgi:arylsulfatase
MPTAHIIALCTALLLGACAASQPPRPPNIVIVLLDDLGYSDYGAYGSEIRTPHIDALADNGVVLDQLYVTPRCSPTRAALLTGEDPHTAGLGFLPLPEGADAPPGPYQGSAGVAMPPTCRANGTWVKRRGIGRRATDSTATSA